MAEHGGAGVRRFIALGVPDPVVRALAAETAHLRQPQAELRPTAPESWHVTLAYLGETPSSARPTIVGRLRDHLEADAIRPAPRLSVAGAGRFGDRVLLAHLRDDPRGALAAFVAALHAGLREAGFGIDQRTFRPHVTLARARGPARVGREDVAALRLDRHGWRPSQVGVWATAPPGASTPYVVEAEVAWPSPGSSSGPSSG